MKTSELIGVALDWAVAECEFVGTPPIKEVSGVLYTVEGDYWSPSTDWAHGGPIIEREKMSVEHCNTDTSESPWSACSAGGKYHFGPTPLIAAMRCYVASRLGDEVEIPEELK